MGDIEHEALAVAGRGTHKRAPDRLRQALRDILRQRQRRRETCIGKATGSGQDAATTNGPADYIYADLGCDVSPEDMATMKAHIIQHGAAPAQVGTRTIKGATLSDQVQQPARIALETGVNTADDGEGCPLVMHRSHKVSASQASSRQRTTGERRARSTGQASSK
ncbi:hypothetical protein ERJ75_001567300 [Trypanosoma vivax]|nr:hypothetical protein ERJ75_001567300 [Trypanosoma vivax]